MVPSSLTLLKSQTQYVPDLSAYQLQFNVTASNVISPYVFVKQRLRSLDKSTFTDVLAAIATPVQLQDLSIKAPDNTTSYFLDNECTLVAATMGEIDYLATTIQSDIQKLLSDFDLYQVYLASEYITLTAATVSETYPTTMPPITITPMGANPVIGIDTTLTDFYIVNLLNATGTPTVQYANLQPGQKGFIEIQQPYATNLNITFPANSEQGRGGGNTYLGVGVNTTDLIKWTYDGANILFDSQAGYS